MCGFPSTKRPGFRLKCWMMLDGCTTWYSLYIASRNWVESPKRSNKNTDRTPNGHVSSRNVIVSIPIHWASNIRTKLRRKAYLLARLTRECEALAPGFSRGNLHSFKGLDMCDQSNVATEISRTYRRFSQPETSIYNHSKRNCPLHSPLLWCLMTP